MQLRKKTLIAVISVTGAAFFAVQLYRSAQTKRALADWYACARDIAAPTIKQRIAITSEDLMQIVLSECKRQYQLVADKCGSETNCATTVLHTTIVNSNFIREQIVWAREQSRKRDQIETSVKELEKIGVHRDDIKDFFRDEILADIAEEKNAQDEAKAAADGDR